MLSPAAAARLLASCRSSADFAPILAELGFANPSAAIPPEKNKALDLPLEVSPARVARGAGALRALVFEIDGGMDLRNLLSAIAAKVSSHAPQYLWMIFAAGASRRAVAIAAVDNGQAHPRVAALVVDRDHLVDSDGETLSALAGEREQSDSIRHSRWVEILGREPVNRRFFRELERLVAHLAATLCPHPSPSDANELALLYVSRLLFLSFLETKGWLNGDRGFLANQFARCMLNGGGYHSGVLRPLFFGTLNTRPARRSPRSRAFGKIPFLNGGLFARSDLERRTSLACFPDESIGDLFGDLLTRYRFTAREDAMTWSEAAVDPEMLGKAFESLMSSHYRKTSGAFYTPQTMVREVTRSALAQVPAAGCTLAGVAELRILDPACGSGAFLVYILEELCGLRKRLGDTRPGHAIRREVLTRSIFGVDVNPVAVWLCELRLWLSMVIDDPESHPMQVEPLPNLDRNIRVGDSLAGGSFDSCGSGFENRRIAQVRRRYARSTGAGKRSLAKALDTLERRCAIVSFESRLSALSHRRREILIAARSRDLFGSRAHPPRTLSIDLNELRRAIRESREIITRLRAGGALPFSFATHFADVAERGGFDLVIGNPPWIRTRHLDPHSRASLRRHFEAYRCAVWSSGAAAAGAGTGFGSQIDAAALFIEKSLHLVRDGGIVSLIVPAKLWRSLAGGGIRQILLDQSDLKEIHDLTNAAQEFDAAVYPSVIVARRRLNRAESSARCIPVQSHLAGDVRRFTVLPKALPFDATRGSPWILAPGPVRDAFDLLRARGTRLSESALGRPLLGVKTGFNRAFIMTRDEAESRGIEAFLLRPLIRGSSLAAGKIKSSSEVILFPYDGTGPLSRLPAGAARWLNRWRRDLETRADMRGTDRWWRLFRTECVTAQRPRLLWADINKTPRVAILKAGDTSVPLNTCYVLPARDDIDARAFAVLMSSALTSSWLSLVAEPVRGGYRRYFGWTISLLPVPRDWARARKILSSVSAGDSSASDTLSATLEAYEMTMHDALPLLEWK